MLDIIGRIPQIDNTDPENPVVTWLGGWHVNTSRKLAGLDGHQVFPETPYRVIAGCTTYSYQFDSEQQAKELLNYDAEDGYQPEFEPVAEPVPLEVTRRQALTVIKQAGFKGAIDAAIEAIADEQQRIAAETYWQESLYFERDNQLLNLLADVVGLSQQQLDDMFRRAGQL